MPRKEQGWITFQSSDEERQILEQICQQTQGTKTEILWEMIRQVGRSSFTTSESNTIEFSEGLEEEEVMMLSAIPVRETADTAAL